MANGPRVAEIELIAPSPAARGDAAAAIRQLIIDTPELGSIAQPLSALLDSWSGPTMSMDVGPATAILATDASASADLTIDYK